MGGPGLRIVFGAIGDAPDERVGPPSRPILHSVHEPQPPPQPGNRLTVITEPAVRETAIIQQPGHRHLVKKEDVSVENG